MKVQHDISDRLFGWLLAVTTPSQNQSVRIVWNKIRIKGQSFSISGVMTNMEVRMEASQQMAVTAKAVDRHGNPARVENPAWSSSDPDVASVVQDATDPMKAVITSRSTPVGPGEVLSAVVTCSADADLDVDETRSIVGAGTIMLIETEAELFSLEFEAPTDVPTEPAPGPEPTPQ